MDLLNILSEALKSERDISKVEKIELNVPQLEIKTRLENQKAGRESKFKKVTDEQISMDPSDGFFFKYNPHKNTYYESNASFTFITGVNIRHRLGASRWQTAPHAYDLKPITHLELGHDDWNFRVDKRTKKVILQKAWGERNRLEPVTITDPEIVKDALQIAMRYHPELKDYTFAKMKIPEYLKTGAATLEAGGTLKAYFVSDGENFKKFKSEGIKTDSKVNLYLDIREAKKGSKELRYFRKLYPVWALGEVAIKDKDTLGEKSGDAFSVGKDIPASDIKLTKTNMEEYFDKGFTLPDNLQPDLEKEYPTLFFGRWSSKIAWDYLFIARDQAEWDKIQSFRKPEYHTKRRGKQRGPDTKTTFRGYPETDVVQLIINTDAKILMFKPGTTKEQIHRFLADQWIGYRRLISYLPWEMKQNIKAGLGYDIYFGKKYPEWLMHYMIEKSFSEESDSAAQVKSITPPFEKEG